MALAIHELKLATVVADDDNEGDLADLPANGKGDKKMAGSGE